MFLHSRDKQDPDWTKSDLLKIAENDHQTTQAGPKSSSLEIATTVPAVILLL